MLDQHNEFNVLDEWPSSFFEVFIGVVLKSVIKVFESPSIKEITDFVPIIAIDVLLFNEKRLLILTERDAGFVLLIVFFPYSISVKSIFISLGLNFRQFYKIYFFGISWKCFSIRALDRFDASSFGRRSIQFIDSLNIFEADGFDDLIFFKNERGFADKSEVGKDVFHDGFFEENMAISDILLKSGKFEFRGILDFYVKEKVLFREACWSRFCWSSFLRKSIF